MKAMKTIIATVAVLLFAGALYAAEDIAVTSKISEVVVYPDSALITRAGLLQVKPGAYKAVFSDIIPVFDENSIKVSAKGDASIKLFGAQVKTEFLEEAPSQNIEQLNKQIQDLEDSVKQLNDTKALLLEEREFLDSIKLFSGNQISKDLVTKIPSTQDLDNMLKFLDTKLKENYSAIRGADIKIREASKKADALNRQLAEIAGYVKKQKRSVIVEFEVLKAGSLEMTISYLANAASWKPIYDARAAFDKGEAELMSYGIVNQKTGEEWQDVDITLSTAKPTIGGTMPEPYSWLLRPYQPVTYKRYKTSGGVYAEKAMIAYDLSAESGGIGAVEESPVPATTVEEKGIAVNYKLPLRATVKSDGSDHKLSIISQVLKADFEYSSYQRTTDLAYLRSRVKNDPKLQLLSGDVNIFLEGDFVGSSIIANIAPGEEFDLYLGADENVKVKRELLEKKVDETLIAGIPSPTRRTKFRYKITVENYKSKKVKVQLYDSMPVSQDDRIKVKMDDISIMPDEKDWKDKKGVYLWKLELEPKAKKEISFSFTIEHPRDMQVEGL